MLKTALLVLLTASQPNNHDRLNSRFRFFGANSTSASAVTCVSPQYLVGTTCTDPQFSFATASGTGMTAECAGTALTSVQGGAVTFTRASSAYCTIGNETTGLSNSSMVLLTTDAPRAMKGGDGSGAVGLKMELAANNLFIRSQEFDNAAWTKTGVVVAAPTVTADQAVAPDGTTTAERIQIPAVDATGAQASYIFQGILSTGTVSAGSYLKGNGTSGTLYSLIGPVSGVFVCKACPYVSTSWTRCAEENITTTSAAAYFIGVYGNTYGCGEGASVAQDLFIWQGDMNTGAILTSSILTTSAVASRAVEAATTPYTAAGGTISMSATAVLPTVFNSNGPTVIGLFFDANNRLRMNEEIPTGITTTLNALFRIASGNKNSLGLITFNQGSTVDIAGYYDGVNVGACVGGSCTKTAQTFTMPTGTATVQLGCNPTSGTSLVINGTVKNTCVDPIHCPSYGL